MAHEIDKVYKFGPLSAYSFKDRFVIKAADLAFYFLIRVIGSTIRYETEGWEQQAVDLVEMVGLTPRVDDLPTTFSRGLKQKAAIAMAFVRPFDVMLVDEPFVGLDRTGRDALLELFTLAHADGATLIVATHELSTVKTSDRLLALNGGHLSYDGSPDAADVVMLTEGIPAGEE